MTGPRVDFDGASAMVAPAGADAQGVPQIPRILSPDEFEQTKQLSPTQLAKVKFPAAPPVFAPKDQTKRLDPNADRGAAASPGTPLTGLPGILTRQVAQPMMDNPLATVMTGLVPGAPVALAGSMIHDIAAYAGQKAAEMSLPPEERTLAEADPSRISGESAAVQAAMLALAPLIHGAVKSIGGAGEAVGSAVDAFKSPDVAGLAPALPLDPLAHPAAAQALGSLAGRAGMDESASPYRGDNAETAPLHAAWMEGHAQGLKNAQTAADYGTGEQGTEERFSGLPVTADLRARVDAHMAAVTDAWNVMFDPAARGGQAGEAAGILRATTGRMAQAYEQAAYKLDDFRKAIDPLPDADKLGFIDAIETGKSQPNPEFQKPADMIRSILDEGRQSVQDLGTGKLEDFIENYFPHIWNDPVRARAQFVDAQRQGLEVGGPNPLPDAASPDALATAQAQAGGKRPMAGAGSFLKQRTIPTTADGIALGLTPVSTNPVDLTLLKLREMQKYVMAHQSLGEMKDAGLVKFVGAGSPRPDGYARISDNIATVFGPRQGGVNLPEGANISPDDVGVPGRRIMGEYWAPEPVARLVNNYLSPGLRGNAFYDAYRGLGNGLNQAQLGLSGFHVGMTGLNAVISRVGLGIEHLASGDLGDAADALVSASAAPVSNLLQGAKIRSTYLDPTVPTPLLDFLNKPLTGKSPDYEALANAVAESGGRVRQDSFYKNSAPEKMAAAWHEGGLIGTGKAGLYSIPALLEAFNKPLMEHIVPMQKLGVFGDMAAKAMADLPEDASLADHRAALGSVWDSVDNRLGQMVYDNVFWNKTFKDLAMASTRSLGWNLGTIRELGGGIGDALDAAGKVVTGDAANAQLTHRMSYAMALPITVGMYGAMYQYLRTGQGPQELKDYYYPKTGDQDADGNDERVQLPSYMKDVMAYSRDPWTTVKHKVNPLPLLVTEMLNNQDYYGDEIRNADDPAVKQAMQEAAFLGKQVEPMGISNMLESKKRGDSTPTVVGSELGITPAPRSMVRSDAQNRMAEYIALRGTSGGTPEDAQSRQDRADILAGLRGNTGVDLNAVVTRAIQHEQLTPTAIVKLLKIAGSTPAQEKFKSLTLPQAMDVFNRSTSREKGLFVDALVTKMQRAGKGGTPAPADTSSSGGGGPPHF